MTVAELIEELRKMSFGATVELYDGSGGGTFELTEWWSEKDSAGVDRVVLGRRAW